MMEKQIDERECASVTGPRFLFFFRDINRTDSVDRRRLIDVTFCDVKDMHIAGSASRGFLSLITLNIVRVLRKIRRIFRGDV